MRKALNQNRSLRIHTAAGCGSWCAGKLFWELRPSSVCVFVCNVGFTATKTTTNTHNVLISWIISSLRAFFSLPVCLATFDNSIRKNLKWNFRKVPVFLHDRSSSYRKARLLLDCDWQKSEYMIVQILSFDFPSSIQFNSIQASRKTNRILCENIN